MKREKISFGMIFNLIQDQVQGLTSKKNFKYLATGLGVVVLSLGLFKMYQRYRSSQEQAAQKAFADCMHVLQEASVDSDQWTDAAQLFGRAAKQYSGSVLAPYMKALQGQALAEQGEKEQAIEILSQAVSEIPSTVSLYGLYAAKLALMKLDSQDETVQKEGLDLLHELAYTENNTQRDYALYYLGLYAWSKNDLQEADAAWQDLIALKSDDPQKNSPWIERAQEKVKLINI